MDVGLVYDGVAPGIVASALDVDLAVLVAVVV